MDNDKNSKQFESVFSHKVRAGKRRTYFFDVKKTKGDDFYITLTESTRRFNGDGYERHKIFLYKEDFNRFIEGLEETVNYIKAELMPEYDYDEYTRRNKEWEEQRELEEQESSEPKSEEPKSEEVKSEEVKPAVTKKEGEDREDVEDMAW